jgi:hypothetical protein
MMKTFSEFLSEGWADKLTTAQHVFLNQLLNDNGPEDGPDGDIDSFTLDQVKAKLKAITPEDLNPAGQKVFQLTSQGFEGELHCRIH